MTARESCMALSYPADRKKWPDIGQLADYDRANGEFMQVFA